LLERGGGISGNNVDEKYVSNIVTNGILIWRISIQYLPAIIGISIFGAMIGGNIKKIIKHEKIFRD
jgi:hypothetical protein